MARRVFSRVLAVSLMAALLPMTPAFATTSAESAVTQAGRDAGPFVSQPFSAGRTTKPLKDLGHQPSATRDDPGEGLGRGRTTPKEPSTGKKDPVLQSAQSASGSATKADAREAGQELRRRSCPSPGRRAPLQPARPQRRCRPEPLRPDGQLPRVSRSGTSRARPSPEAVNYQHALGQRHYRRHRLRPVPKSERRRPDRPVRPGGRPVHDPASSPTRTRCCSRRYVPDVYRLLADP